MSGKEYVKNSIRLVKSMVEKKGLQLQTGKSMNRPMRKEYRPELDISPELSKEEHAEYQQLIGMLGWATELGRIDILFELSLLSSHLALPCEGHLEAVYGIFAYLDKHLDCNLVFDYYKPKIDTSSFTSTDWSKSLYWDHPEEVPPKALQPLGNEVQMVCFVDASHAGEYYSRRSYL